MKGEQSHQKLKKEHFENKNRVINVNCKRCIIENI